VVEQQQQQQEEKEAQEQKDRKGKEHRRKEEALRRERKEMRASAGVEGAAVLQRPMWQRRGDWRWIWVLGSQAPHQSACTRGLCSLIRVMVLGWRPSRLQRTCAVSTALGQTRLNQGGGSATSQATRCTHPFQGVTLAQTTR